MRYAIPCVHNEVFQHFGKTPSFMIVDIEDDIVKKELVSTNGKGHGALVGFLAQHHVDILVCGGIGQGARDALTAQHIQFISGAKGNIDVILSQLVEGTLQDDPSGMCHHHDNETHPCGQHNCIN